MLYSEVPISYDKICMNVRHTLMDYDKYEENIPRKEIEKSLNKMYQKQGQIREKLDIAESNAMGIVSDWESFNQWFSVLKESNDEMDHKEKDDETQLGKLRLAFSSNANQLKSLEGDILSCCRKLPDTMESPQVIRLKSVYSKAKEYYSERSHVLSEIDEEMKIADEKFDNISKENITLTNESNEFEKQLALFNNSESFKLVQEARKHRLIEKEWSEKKAQLLNDIDKSKKELENYLGNKDQSLRNLVLESNKQDQEAAKLQSKYHEMMQDVISESNISTTNRATVMKQLHIELDRQKQNQLRKESNITRSEVRTLKNKGDRLVSKMKMEASNSARTFSQALSKLIEPKPNTNSNMTSSTENIPSNNAPRFKNFKGKKKKNSTKSPKKSKLKTSLAPKEPPPRVYSLQELGLMKLQEDKEKYILFLQTKFEPEIQELKNFLQRKVQINQELLQQNLSEILAADKRQKEILLANKIRVQQRISEKDIEISSLNTELVTFEGMVHDYQQNFDQIEKKNEELRKKSLEVIDPSKFIEVRKNIESLDKFVSNTKDYIDALNAEMEITVENSNQSVYKIDETNYMRNIKDIPRSKSLNDIHSVKQKTFKRPKAENQKQRVGTSLSLISKNQPKITSESKPILLPSIITTELTNPVQLPTVEKETKLESIDTPQITTRTVNSTEINFNDLNKPKSNEIPVTVESSAVSIITKNEDETPSFQPKEPTEEKTKKTTFSVHHITESAPDSSSSISIQQSNTDNQVPSIQIPSSITKKTSSNVTFIQQQPKEEEEEELNDVHGVVTKVQTEEPKLNVTQPPSCKSSNTKPQSQLQIQIQPPLEQGNFIRKAPTLGADTRAFTIEARVSSAASPPSSPSHTSRFNQSPKQNNLFLSSSLKSNDSNFDNNNNNIYQQMIDQSNDSYKITGESNNIQLQKRKTKKNRNSKISQNQNHIDPLVLLSVSPMSHSSNLKTNMNVNSVQMNKFDGQIMTIGNDNAKRKSRISASHGLEKKEKRFMIFVADDQQSKKQIILSARRRAIIEVENRVHVIKQKRRNSATKVHQNEKVRVIKKDKFK